MPSIFQPGGIVQHEYFISFKPVIAFKTGGLKDSIEEYNGIKKVEMDFYLKIVKIKSF